MLKHFQPQLRKIFFFFRSTCHTASFALDAGVCTNSFVVDGRWAGPPVGQVRRYSKWAGRRSAFLASIDVEVSDVCFCCSPVFIFSGWPAVETVRSQWVLDGTSCQHCVWLQCPTRLRPLANGGIIIDTRSI